MFFETVRPFHFFFKIVKKHLIVCEVSDNLAKLIYPNGTTSVIDDGSLKKRAKGRLRKLILENDFTPKYM